MTKKCSELLMRPWMHLTGQNSRHHSTSLFTVQVIQLIRRFVLSLMLYCDCSTADVPLDALESLGVVSIHLDIDYLDGQSIELAVERGSRFAPTVNSAKQLASLPSD